MSEYSNEEKWRCAEREVRMRQRVFPRRVQLGQMDKREADREIAIMQAIADDYKPKGLFG